MKRIIRSVRGRLIINNLIVVLFVLFVVGFVSYFFIQNYYRGVERDYLTSQANAIRMNVERLLAEPTSDEALAEEIAVVSFISQLRIRLLGPNNVVIVDSGPWRQNRDRLARPRITFVPGADPLFLQGVSDEIVTISLSQRSANTRVRTLELSEGPTFGATTLLAIRRGLTMGGVVALVMAMVAALISGELLVAPLSRLGRAVAQMATGDLAARAPQSKLHEYDQLATRFNEMAEELETTIAALTAERSALQRMIADASHELRTPLTALKTFNELLLEEDEAQREPIHQFLAQSSLQIDLLDQLTSGMLDLSRLEAGLSGTNFAVADVRSTIEAAVEIQRVAAREKRHTLRVKLPEQPILISHDQAVLQQAFSNLIGNGIKYTPAGGIILVTSELSRGQFLLRVTDNGPGIPAQEQPRLFDRFYRGQHTAATGTGLGLAIVKEIVTLHQGSITIDSRVGTGTTATIRLPMSNSHLDSGVTS